ncbi:hypothetical protein [uncultured Ruegeria sp.]|uniref:hypothetical protein n=1 Tax=uncultured Ruegeria sp. TaxID=259304 RepID=UPI002626F228|nr:hypothetical protein [uncultured Ruegeria sp.]
MCFFISIVVKGGDTKAIDVALRRHGRRARPLENASLRKALQSDEHHFLTTVGHCDCGTVLSPGLNSIEKQNSQRSKNVARLRKKGWSATKIDRWIADRTKAEDRAEQQHQLNAPDTFELWTNVIHEVIAIDGVHQAGILLHFYSGHDEDEGIELVRKSVSVDDFTDQLRNIKEDQLLIAVPTSV